MPIAAKTHVRVEVPVLPQTILERLQMHDVWMDVDLCYRYVCRAEETEPTASCGNDDTECSGNCSTESNNDEAACREP